MRFDQFIKSGIKLSFWTPYQQYSLPTLDNYQQHHFFVILHKFVFTNAFQVETELIDKLDILVSENKGDHEYRQLFDAM